MFGISQKQLSMRFKKVKAKTAFTNVSVQMWIEALKLLILGVRVGPIEVLISRKRSKKFLHKASLTSWSLLLLSLAVVAFIHINHPPEVVLSTPVAVSLPVVSNALTEARALVAVVVELAGVETGVSLTYTGDISAPLITLLAGNSSILTAVLIVQTSIVRLFEQVTQGGNDRVTTLPLLFNNTLLQVACLPCYLDMALHDCSFGAEAGSLGVYPQPLQHPVNLRASYMTTGFPSTFDWTATLLPWLACFHTHFLHRSSFLAWGLSFFPFHWGLPYLALS